MLNDFKSLYEIQTNFGLFIIYLYKQNKLIYASLLIWHVAECWILPPNRLPDLYTVINAVISCGYFSLLFLYFIHRQFAPSSATSDVFGGSPSVKIKSA